MATESTLWTISDARELYNIEHWSDGYFDISDHGTILAFPDGRREHPGVDLLELSRAIKKANLRLPVLVRFTDILRSRVDALTNGFYEVINASSYAGKYTAVYPIKVNQQSRVLNAILEHGLERIGLEAGSKPELMAVLALTQRPGTVVVCNGYKDREYIRLALIGQKLGKRVYIILEKLSELDIILEEARKLKINPVLGIRVRLFSMGSGKWQDTSGEKSKFGFSASQVLYVLDRLREADKLDCLKILHFHLGSQIANLSDIQRGMKECAQYYVQLCQEGAPIHTVDVGGGLGIDYEGTQSRSSCSTNYSILDYADTIVRTLMNAADLNSLPHPNIISESGRALTAHHALLLTNIIGCERTEQLPIEIDEETEQAEIIQDLLTVYKSLNKRNALEVYHMACQALAESNQLFYAGSISLPERARIEQIYQTIALNVREMLNPSATAHRKVIDELNDKLADKYFCNFSLFQSLPDSWAIGQIFPIMPISGLDREPTRRVVLQDITCDSDGKIKTYVDGYGKESTLPLLPYSDEHPYLLGMFLVGAYQEILGDLHNLFGDTDSVHVELLPDGSWELVQPELGDTVDEVLRYVHFDSAELLKLFRQQLLKAKLTRREFNEFLSDLTVGLHGYTYLECDQ